MKVNVIGPNLAATGADFHVHKDGCADTKKALYRGHELFAETVTTFKELVELVYGDFLDESPVESFYGDFKVFPCAADLTDVAKDATVGL